MNATSLSATEPGKTATLLRTGVSDTQGTDEPGDAGGFLRILGEAFAGGDGDAEVGKANSTAVTSEAGTKAGIEAAIELDGESDATVAEGEEQIAGDAKLTPEQVKAARSDAPELTDEVVTRQRQLTDTVNAERVATVAADLDSQATAEQRSQSDILVSRTMREGGELLGRLDESNQALKGVVKESNGNNLPQAERLSGQYGAGQSEAEKAEKVPQSVQTPPMVTPSQPHQDVLDKYLVTDSQNSAGVSGEQSDTVAVYAGKELFANADVDNVDIDNPDLSAVFSEPVTKVADNEVTDQLSGSANDSPATWETVKTASALGVSSALGQRETGTPVTDSAVAAWNQGDTVAADDIVTAVDGEFVAESAPALASAINWSSQVEQSSQPAALSKQTENIVASGQHQQSQQMQQQAQQQAIQTALSGQAGEHSQNQPAVHSQAELAALAAQGAHQLTTPVPVKAGAHNPAANGALTAARLGGAGTLADNKEQREADLAQQLAGAAGQPGVQAGHGRNDIQQPSSQPALHMVRDNAAEQLAERVQVMLSKNLRNVDIRLDPPELGRMQIRMSMNGDLASVQFTVNNPQAREMVEHSMPRLREMLAQQGLQLADSSVHQQSGGQQQGYAAGDGGRDSGRSMGPGMDDSGNLDESINLEVNIAAKDDGISYYA